MDFWGRLAAVLHGQPADPDQRKRVKLITFDQCIVLGRAPDQFTTSDVERVVDALVQYHPNAPETAAAECRPIVLDWVEHFKRTGHPGS